MCFPADSIVPLKYCSHSLFRCADKRRKIPKLRCFAHSASVFRTEPFPLLIQILRKFSASVHFQTIFQKRLRTFIFTVMLGFKTMLYLSQSVMSVFHHHYNTVVIQFVSRYYSISKQTTQHFLEYTSFSSKQFFRFERLSFISSLSNARYRYNFSLIRIIQSSILSVIKNGKPKMWRSATV